MLNQKHLKVFTLLSFSLLLVITLALTVGGSAGVAAAAPVEPQKDLDQVVLPPAQEGEANDDEDEILPVDPAAAAEDMRVIFEEMTLVQLHDQEYGYARTTCAGNGLNNIQPSPEGPIVLIPNAGDLSVDGSNVSIKLSPDGEITFIPRTEGQMIRVPMALGDKAEGEEVLSLSLDEAQQLMLAGRLVWTAKDHGPNGNGYGLPGHIAACDPLFNEEQYEDFVGDVDES